MRCSFGDLENSRVPSWGPGGVKRSVIELRLGNKSLGLLSNMLFHFGATRDSWPQWVGRPEILIGPHGHLPGAGTASRPVMVSYIRLRAGRRGRQSHCRTSSRDRWAGLDTCSP